MAVSKADQVQEPIPESFDSIEEAAEFWETHSLGEYWGDTEEADVDVRARRRRRVTLAPEVWERVVHQARLMGVSPETLVNLWLLERARA